MDYNEGTYPEITDIDWTLKDKRVPEPLWLRNFPNLLKLKLGPLFLHDLELLKACPLLVELSCRHNFVCVPYHICLCPNLEVLDIRSNPILSLAGIQYTPKIRVLKCAWGEDGLNAWLSNSHSLRDYNLMQHCPNLTEISIRDNDSANIDWLCYCPNLTSLSIHSETLEYTGDLHYCPNLTSLTINCSVVLESIEGLQSCPNLTYLNCSYNPISSLDSIQSCSNLTYLDCTGCPIVNLSFLQYTPRLVKLKCSECDLASLDGIENCSYLTKLRCRDNRLESIDLIHYCPSLLILDFMNNDVTSIEPVTACPYLTGLDCCNNQITDIGSVKNLPNLTYIYCADNFFATLDGIQYCSLLKSLACDDNENIRMDAAAYLCRLRYFSHSSDAFDYQNPQIQRKSRQVSSYYNTINTDGLSAFDFNTQAARDLITDLMSDPKPTFTLDSITGSGMSTIAIRIIIDYCSNDTFHTYHLLTYAELLAYVWQRIESSHTQRYELVQLLEEQAIDAINKGFEDRFNGLLTVSQASINRY